MSTQTQAEPKEYVVTRMRGNRYRIVHNFPNGDPPATYYVTWGTAPSAIFACTCPAYVFARSRLGWQKPCKHCRGIAALIGRKDIIERMDDKELDKDF